MAWNKKTDVLFISSENMTFFSSLYVKWSFRVSYRAAGSVSRVERSRFAASDEPNVIQNDI